MSAIGGLFSGGGNEAKVQGVTDFQMPTTVGQANTAYDQTQSGLAQQQAFANAVAGQNGIGNQSNVFNQLAGVANGTGPNPAQAALNQATGANIASQAALMAGQRGAGANPALLARQAAMQGGALNQQAAGQGATMQAQQQLNALGQMGGIAGQQVANQAGAVMGYNQAAQSQQNNLLNSINSQNQAKLGNQQSINSANAGLAAGKNKAGADLFSGLVSSAGAAAGMAEGGEVAPVNTDATLPPATGPKSKVGFHLFNSGSTTDPSAAQSTTPVPPNPNTSLEFQAGQEAGKAVGKGIGAAISGIGGLFSGPTGGAPMEAPAGKITGGPQMMLAAAHGGKVPVMLSPGEKYLSPKEVDKVSKSKDKGKEALKEGKKIPGKAKVKGDSYDNDTVHASLEAGGIVLPRSVTQSEDPAAEAAKFVTAILAKHTMKAKK